MKCETVIYLQTNIMLYNDMHKTCSDNLGVSNFNIGEWIGNMGLSENQVPHKIHALIITFPTKIAGIWLVL
jgi:hypothetical protein